MQYKPEETHFMIDHNFKLLTSASKWCNPQNEWKSL